MIMAVSLTAPKAAASVFADLGEYRMAVDTFTTSDGIRLAYTVDDFTDPWRQADTLLLLHAAVGHAKRFYAWVPPLCRHYRVVRLDLRGHGASQVPPESSALDMARLVADVEELLAHLRVEACHIVGNSAGGYIAQNLAMKSPEKVRSLMLFGSTAGLRNSQAASWLPRIAKDGLRGFFRETIAERLPLDQVPKGLVDWFVDETGKNDPAWIARFVGYMSQQEWSDKLPAIKCPTLLVLPGGETVGSIRNYDVMIDRIPDVQAITYEGLPHNICDAVPDRCAADVLAFLRWRFGLPA
jgi:pimeloyl-ACP methyl ester carboxylesterase